MRDGKLVSEAAGWGRSIKSVQNMPAPRPRNTDRYTNAILTTPAGIPPTALTMSREDV
jgi:dihydroorotase